jgi:hypothetical protein
VDRRQIVGNLLMKANKYRNFARWVSDWETAQRILALAEELKNRARALARPDERRIRKRAREIWEENSRPVGSDRSMYSTETETTPDVNGSRWETIAAA